MLVQFEILQNKTTFTEDLFEKTLHKCSLLTEMKMR